ncbi:hypothetical protein LCGC14_2998050 [marine sediment metagenome]|uniref:Uncharacterized protein n=1 Tax=marine sediment metagenome TaxID=412755 RepID=A0A0F8X1V0_9ZZZZ
MAKPKHKFLVKENEFSITVWTDSLVSDLAEIKTIEGTDTVLMLNGKNPISVFLDPRYDLKEIAEEIRELLTARIPDVFRE